MEVYWNFLFVLKANTGAFGQLFLQFLQITNKSYSLLNRSLLLFAKGKPLGKKGFDWLKTHCINLTEIKKKSPVAERLAYADEVMEDILGRVFSMNLTESPDSDCESLSQTEAIITRVTF